MQIINSENIARKSVEKIDKRKGWPCFLFKQIHPWRKFEEFFLGDDDNLKIYNYNEIQVIDLNQHKDLKKITNFLKNFTKLKNRKWSEDNIKKIVKKVLTNFKHKKTNKSLEQKM